MIIKVSDLPNGRPAEYWHITSAQWDVLRRLRDAGAITANIEEIRIIQMG